jgi:hypothetical protein
MDAPEATDDELYPEETVLDEVDAVLELFDIGAKRRQAEFRRWLVAIVEEDEDSPALAEKARTLYRSFKPMNRVRLVDLSCGYWPAGPLVCGALLHEIVGDPGCFGELFDNAGDDILRWFRRVPLDSVMLERDRRALEALPSNFEAYHEIAQSAGRPVLGPFWILPDAAKSIIAKAEANGARPPRMVRAQVPRAAVLAYYSGNEIHSLIVDYRRVSDVVEVGR